MNEMKTGILLAGMTALFMAAGFLLGGEAGMLLALAFAVATNFFAYWNADSLVLKMYKAREVSGSTAPEFYGIVEQLARKAALPLPRVYIIENEQPNAFATGRNPEHSVVCVTEGLLQSINREELEGVIAHELSHIRHHDITVSTIVVTLVGTLALLSDLAIRTMWWNGGRVRREGDRADRSNPLALIGLILILLSPLIARVLQAAVSRQRETLADEGACHLTRYPPGLISALEKLKADTTVTHSASTATAHLWIEQPMSGVGDRGRLGGFHRLFDTHPPLDERIAHLRDL